MLYTGNEEYKPENYTDYKNRTMSKNIDKFRNQLHGIKSCSLKTKHKGILLVRMADMLTEELNKITIPNQ